MALNNKGEESLMRIKEPQKREKCPLKVTQLQRLNGLSFSAARVPALRQACYPKQDPSPSCESPSFPTQPTSVCWASLGTRGMMDTRPWTWSLSPWAIRVHEALCHILFSTVVRAVTQSCLILCDPVDCSPPGSSVHGILQASLEWVAISSSRGSFPTQGLSPGLLWLLRCQADSLPLSPLGTPSLSFRTIHSVLYSASFPLTPLLTNASAWSLLWSIHSLSRPLGLWPQSLEL